MTLFPERQGFRRPRTDLQRDAVDEPLRNRLWNCISTAGLGGSSGRILTFQSEDRLSATIRALWHGYYKKRLDTIPQVWESTYKQMCSQFMECEWYDVFGFLEFVLAHNDWRDNEERVFQTQCNRVLEEELSAYRLVGRQFTPITSPEEVATVQEALKLSAPLGPVRAHIEAALTKLSDRKSPDYRNSIKESISAVEAMCQVLGGKEKATLGQALKRVEGKLPIHGALADAFEKLYGFTSDAEGIRHALLAEPTLEFEDAKFMLVSCAAFVNYLVAKAARAGIAFR